MMIIYDDHIHAKRSLHPPVNRVMYAEGTRTTQSPKQIQTVMVVQQHS